MGDGRRAGGAIEVQEDRRVAENDRKGDRQDDVEDGVSGNGISIFFKDDSQRRCWSESRRLRRLSERRYQSPKLRWARPRVKSVSLWLGKKPHQNGDGLG